MARFGSLISSKQTRWHRRAVAKNMRKDAQPGCAFLIGLWPHPCPPNQEPAEGDGPRVMSRPGGAHMKTMFLCAIATLIRDHYACFNERRIADVAALFSADAVLDMPPFVQNAVGGDAYVQFAEAWLGAYLATVWELSDELANSQGDLERQRDVTERLGRALDAARHAVRPQFNR